MWRIVALFTVASVACAGAPAKHHRGDPRPRPPAPASEQRGPMRLVFEPAPARVGDEVEVSDAAELEAALASKRSKPTAGLTEIVEITWGERVLDRAAIRKIVEAYPDWPARNALRQQYGLADYEAVLRVVLQGYAAQLAQRFGIEVREVWAGREQSELRVGVRGLFGGRGIEWKAGSFAPSHITAYPPRPARVPRTVETLITSERGDYYHVKDLGLAHFRPSDAPASGDKVHHGAVLRTYGEPAELVDANGARYRVELEVTRPTPYVIARPGGLPRSGLTKSAHLVRLELDDSALGGSAPIIESVTVLDGTPAFPAELDAAYRAVWQHYSSDARGAELAVAADVKTTLADFDTRTKAWAKQVQPTGRVEASERRYVHSNPVYTWNASAKTLGVTFSHEEHVIHTKIIKYPNPELVNFRCPPGVPCAVPPDTQAHELELEYIIAFTASYRIDGDGRIMRETPPQPRVRVAR